MAKKNSQPKPKSKPVTAKSFNDRAATYVAFKNTIDDAKATLDDEKEPFVRFVRRKGSKLDRGDKSLRYATELYEAVATWGTKTTIDEAEVLRFKAALDRARLSELFPLIFKAETTHVLAPEHVNTVKELPSKLQRSFRRVLQSTPKAPSLAVRAVKPEAASAAAAD